MTLAVLLTFINLFVNIFNFLILIRVIFSWVMPGSTNLLSRTMFNLTEPVLAPVRKLIPGGGMLDLSPIVTYFLLLGLQALANNLLTR